MHWTAGQYGAAEHAALKTIEHARAVGDRTREIRILPALATCSTYGPTPVDEAAARCAHLLEEVGGDQKADALIRASLARLEAMRGNFEEARQLYRRSRATLEEFGWNLFAALTSIDSGSVELLARDPVAAEGELRRDFETLDAMGERNYIATTVGVPGVRAAAPGQVRRGRPFVTFSEETAAPDDLTSQFLWRQFRARLLSIHDKHDDAIALALRAVELTDETEETESQGNSRLDLAHVYCAGRHDRRGRGRPSVRRRNASERKGIVGARRRRPATPRRAQFVTTTLPHIPEQCPFVSVEWNMHRNLNVPACVGTCRSSTCAGRQVVVEVPVPPVGGHGVRAADGTST